MQPCQPERLVGVDVAHARDQLLVEQRPLDARVLRRRRTSAAPPRSSTRVEQIAADVRDGHRDAGGAGAASPPGPPSAVGTSSVTAR